MKKEMLKACDMAEKALTHVEEYCREYAVAVARGLAKPPQGMCVFVDGDFAEFSWHDKPIAQVLLDDETFFLLSFRTPVTRTFVNAASEYYHEEKQR